MLPRGRPFDHAEGPVRGPAHRSFATLGSRRRRQQIPVTTFVPFGQESNSISPFTIGRGFIPSATSRSRLHPGLEEVGRTGALP